MGRPRKSNMVNMGGRYEPAIATKFGNLCQAGGVSIREALRRLMVNAILEGHIPGIDAMELDQKRDRAKYGEVVPTFDGDSNALPEPERRAGKKASNERPVQ